MKAQNLSLCIVNNGCNKKCPYCVSKMTGSIISNPSLFSQNLPKVLTIARSAQVSSVLITGKGEPCLASVDAIVCLLNIFHDFPVELQTNGLVLLRSPNQISKLAKNGLNILALSMDRMEDFDILEPVIKKANEQGLITRVTMCMTDVVTSIPFDCMIERCKKSGVRQFSLRRVVAPTDAVDTQESRDAQEWIKKNVTGNEDVLLHDMRKSLTNGGRWIRALPYGAQIYDYHGIAVTYFDYCVQDKNGDDDIRSLIYAEDGHMYTTWNSKASILF